MIGFKAVCQEQRLQEKKVLLVIIVGTAALEACTSIIALIKVLPV